jgi:hypothetical protein
LGDIGFRKIDKKAKYIFGNLLYIDGMADENEGVDLEVRMEIEKHAPGNIHSILLPPKKPIGNGNGI